MLYTRQEKCQEKYELMLQDARKPITVPVRKLSVYFQPFRRNSFLECALQRRSQKSIKTSYFETSRFFKVIDVNMTKKFVISVCCDRQHARGDLQPFSGETSQQR